MGENQIDIPERWVEISQLANLSKVFNGLSGKTKVDFGTGEPYIPYVNVFKNSKVDNTELDYVKIKLGEKQNVIEYGDLIFTTSSETIEEVGMTSVFLERTGTYYLNSFCFILRLNKSDWLVPEFSQYLFRTENLRYSISLLGQGSTRYNLSKTRLLKELKFIIPSNKKEQTQIATILSKVDEAISQTEQLIAKYSRIKTGLMQDLLTKGIDENGNIRSEETHEFKDNPLGRIPKEWECLSIGDVANRLRSGVTPKGGSEVYQKDGIMLIRSQNVHSYGFKLDDVAYISDEINSRMSGSQLEKFDVLLNITGASIGRSTCVPNNHPLSNVNQHVCSIRFQHSSLEKAVYLSTFLNSVYGQNQIQQNNAGSNREGINYNQIRSIQIPWFERDRSIIVRAPHHLTVDKIDKIVQSKKQWLKEKLNHAQKYPLVSESKEFVSGETLMFLGKNYQLLVVDEEIDGVEFNQRFKISKASQPIANELFKKWYLSQALKRIEPLATKYAKSLGVKYNQFKTSEMKYRWGSCTPANNIIFNWRIIKAPMYVLEYLVAHELVHLIENNHTPRFWNILSIQVPNFEKAKNWLKKNGQLLEVDF